MYYYIDRGKKMEISGRGLTLGDAYSAFGYSLSGFDPQSQSAQLLYKPGKLRFRRIAEEAIPLLQYDDSEDEALCCAFQIRLKNGRYYDLDIYLLSKSLTYIMRR